jgi:hypothetical protein
VTTDGVLRELRRLGACVLLAGLLGLPLALSWAVTHTEVSEKVGTSPTTFTLSTQGHSEVRLGIAGTVYVPEAIGPLGIVATVDGPGDPGVGDGDLAGYVRPEMLELYAGLFHDPQDAVDQYVGLVRAELGRQLLVSTAFVAGAGGLAAYAVSRLLPVRLSRDGVARWRIAGAVALALTATTGLAWVQVRGADGGRGPTSGAYELPVLDGTLAQGATTDSAVIRLLATSAVSTARTLVERQEAAEERYRETALAALAVQAGQMEGPRDGEVSVMMQSDMHCNTTMIRLQRRVFEMLAEADRAPSLLAIAGDLTTNGTAAEGTCIRNEREIAGDAPVVAIGGNHETDLSEEQMRDAGMTVLDGEVEEVGGVRVLGDLDPSRTELFGSSRPRGDESQEGQGERLRQVAEDAEDRPDLVLLHEAYAAQAFLGLASVADYLDTEDTDDTEDTGDTDDTDSALTTPPADAADDGVDDVPAGAVFYGHWHRSVGPRVLWNSDGTWTLLMELDTTGGAVATPTIGNFSTPWSRPQQEASFPVLFLDEETRLVTGYQLYRFDTDGSVTVEPRVEVGGPTEEAAS